MDRGTWYLEAGATLDLKHRLHSTFEKSIVERAIIEYAKKNRTECFDDYYLFMYKEKKNAIYFMFINGRMILFLFMMYNAVKSHLKFSIINELIGGGILNLTGPSVDQ